MEVTYYLTVLRSTTEFEEPQAVGERIWVGLAVCAQSEEELGFLRICYHGTNEVNAKSILKRGFLPNTYFAAHLEDAIRYGGNHVFEVAFHKAPDKWQFVCPEKVQASMIVSYAVYTARVKFRNDSLRNKVFESNIKKSKFVR